MNGQVEEATCWNTPSCVQMTFQMKHILELIQRRFLQAEQIIQYRLTSEHLINIQIELNGSDVQSMEHTLVEAT